MREISCQLSVVVGAGARKQIHGSSHNLRSKPARTVISYQLPSILNRLHVAFTVSCQLLTVNYSTSSY
ncbi:hypothetical protein [Scytonema millei]|uniref:Uncharacterized protein n=1 Tax=Scytonema millei VB511283 TaxID=1245923 RepID=A0A9X5E9T0_9CYAN|nr:hypothetical protein [Scytonema millei]NHC36702.1 hypothetical protein [Scytonema millei VB511283]